MIFKTTTGQRSKITPKQRAKHSFYRIVIMGLVLFIVFI